MFKNKIYILLLAASLLFASTTQSFAAENTKKIDPSDNAEANKVILTQIANGSDTLVSTDKITPSPQWASGGSNHTHQYIVARGLSVLLPNDGYTNIYDWFLGKDPNLDIMSYADWPDANETDPVSGVNTMWGHFYWSGQTGTTASNRFSGWYTDAVNKANGGDWTGSMQSLGKALHYAGDMSCPVHVMAAGYGAITPTNHTMFESYADTNRFNYMATSSGLESTFSSLTTSGISDNMANYARGYYVDVSQMAYDSQQTWLNWGVTDSLPRAQKNIAARGLANISLNHTSSNFITST